MPVKIEEQQGKGTAAGRQDDFAKPVARLAQARGVHNQLSLGADHLL